MADRIRVDTEQFNKWIRMLDGVADDVQSVRSKLLRIDTSAEWWEEVRTSVGGQTFRRVFAPGTFQPLGCGVGGGTVSGRTTVSAMAASLSAYSKDIDAVSQKVAAARSCFENTEAKIISAIDALSAGTGRDEASVGASLHASDLEQGVSIADIFSDWFSKLKTGAHVVSGKLSEWKSAIVQSWKEKGTIYRIVKGVGAAVQIVGGVATVVCAALGTGVTAGMGAPATVVVGVYGANSAISGIADLWNCITGDVDKIGNVDVLKSGMSIIGGQAGKWLGNEQIGQSVGEAVYHAGSIATVVVSMKNLAGKIIQSPNAGASLKQSIELTKQTLKNAKGEVSQGLKGVWDIATKSDLSAIKYDFAMLKHTIPNICNVVSDVGLIKSGVENGCKLIDKGGNLVESITDWSINRKSIDPLKEIKDTLSGSAGAVDDIKNIWDGAKDYLEYKSLIGGRA